MTMALKMNDNINYTIGAYFGNETLNQEYKVYCMNSLKKYFDHEIIQKIFEQKIFEQKSLDKKTFNKMVRNDISENIIEYLPKYIGNYSASNISGQLHFGISDDGIIEGIPYFGHNISKQFIKKTIDKCFREYIRSKDERAGAVLWFKNNLTFDIIKLNVNEYLLDDFNLYRLAKMKQDIEIAKKELEDYQYEFKTWYKSLMKYSIKLKSLINDFNIRKEIINFIFDNNSDNEDKSYLKAVEFYESTQLIDYEITGSMLYGCTDDNPLKWLIAYKDYILNIIKLNKPKQPLYKPTSINYYEYAKHINNVRNHLLSDKCEFYMITFNIPNHPTGEHIEYKDKYGKWHCKMRLIDKYGPYCKLC
jgi:hypothetical protein